MLRNIKLALFCKLIDPSLTNEMRELLSIRKINSLNVKKAKVVSLVKIEKYLM